MAGTALQSENINNNIWLDLWWVDIGTAPAGPADVLLEKVQQMYCGAIVILRISILLELNENMLQMIFRAKILMRSFLRSAEIQG